MLDKEFSPVNTEIIHHMLDACSQRVMGELRSIEGYQFDVVYVTFT